jgi:flavin-dependent dehydrogenase
VGGGTSGAAAALYAARFGMRTLLIEMNGVLGGTATAGGVSTYWFGLRGGATGEIDRKVDQYYRQLSLIRSACLWSNDDIFLPDIKALAMLDLCVEAGCSIQFESIVCAVILDGAAVRGVAFAKDGQLHLAYARAVIDCTGDGDVAMFAGRPHLRQQ